MTKLLAGYRVIESSMLLNGAATGMMLADLGAEVIKVESPSTGDYIRLPETRHLHLQANKNKRSLTIDLKQEAGRALFYRLVETADAFVTNAVGTANERLGIDYAALRARKPDIVYCQNTGFGSTGPFGQVPAHGQMMDAMGGALPFEMGEDGLTAPKDGYLRRTNTMVSAGDGVSMGAIYAGFHIAAALAHRERTGEGSYIDVSSAQAVVASAWLAATTQINRPERRGWWQDPANTRPVARYQAYAARDGKLLLFCPEENKFWALFCKLVDRPDLVEETRGETLRRALQAIIATRDRADWLALAVEHRLPIGPVNDGIDEVRADPQIASRPMFVEGEGDGRPFVYIGQPAIVDGVAYEAPAPAPELGADNAALLAELGYSPQDVAALAAARVTEAPQAERHMISAIYGDEKE
ncbi:MAG: CoA transferase [Bradyrhizobium sp.]|nr:CoA transferase [Bradyrhizobium sp.]